MRDRNDRLRPALRLHPLRRAHPLGLIHTTNHKPIPNIMCNFKSALVIRDESRKGGFELFLSPWAESHSTLMLMRGIKDGNRINCARVEFSPPDLSTADKVETYKLRLDEQREPEWWSDEMAESVAKKMAVYIKSIIISGDAAILIGGQFILASGAKVESAENCIITTMCDSSSVGTMYDSSKVGTMCGSSSVGTMCDSSSVGTMYGSSSVGTMWDSSKVGAMRDSSSVGTMCGSSKVGAMCGSSSVGTMCGSSSVGTMWDSSKVGAMRDSSQVGAMRDSSQVGAMRDSSNIKNDKRTKNQ